MEYETGVRNVKSVVKLALKKSLAQSTTDALKKKKRNAFRVTHSIGLSKGPRHLTGNKVNKSEKTLKKESQEP